jgi:hypothetical protein
VYCSFLFNFCFVITFYFRIFRMFSVSDTICTEALNQICLIIKHKHQFLYYHKQYHHFFIIGKQKHVFGKCGGEKRKSWWPISTTKAWWTAIGYSHRPSVPSLISSQPHPLNSCSKHFSEQDYILSSWFGWMPRVGSKHTSRAVFCSMWRWQIIGLAKSVYDITMHSNLWPIN